MELYEKIYVKPDFLETVHGEIGCEVCHGGDPGDSDWQTAHQKVVRDPTFPDPAATCGECHADIVASAPQGLHYTLAPLRRSVEIRSQGATPETGRIVHEAREKHCAQCHSSCGQCHVSRPDYVAGGFLDRHHFQAKPPMNTTCASCHGGRVHGEYTGAKEDFKPDIHYDGGEMTCLSCHKGEEMHAAAGKIPSRFEVPQRPKCAACHADAEAEESSNRSHRLHRRKVACQVCHAQANKNCFSCHVGTDQKGLAYFKCGRTTTLFKIGLNPRRTDERPQDFVVLRHPPVDPTLFDAYVANALPDFDAVPTWKLDTPHNLRRHTPQNKTCNGCHGNAELFLGEADLAPWEKAANKAVIVPQERIPKPVEE